MMLGLPRGCRRQAWHCRGLQIVRPPILGPSRRTLGCLKDCADSAGEVPLARVNYRAFGKGREAGITGARGALRWIDRREVPPLREPTRSNEANAKKGCRLAPVGMTT